MRRPLACHASRLATALLLMTAACGPGVGGSGDDDDDDVGGGTDGGPTGNGDGGSQATEQCRKMDLVFVIDDSASMDEEQTNLASNFPAFANLLNSYTISTGETLDYRVGVTTTGITASYTMVIPALPPIIPMDIRTPSSQQGADGRFRTVSGMTRPWLERTDPSMAQTFASVARVGTSGPSLEMQLRAAELAISPSTNPGFLRQDALLGIVYLTDEDDCSRRADGFESRGDGCATNGDVLPPLTDFINAYDQIKGGRGRWAAAVIAAQTSCESDFGSADEGIRLKQFAQMAGSNVVFGDICAGNLTGALQQALDTFQSACENFPPID